MRRISGQATRTYKDGIYIRHVGEAFVVFCIGYLEQEVSRLQVAERKELNPWDHFLEVQIWNGYGQVCLFLNDFSIEIVQSRDQISKLILLVYEELHLGI